MEPYKAMYLTLFHAITDALELLTQFPPGKNAGPVVHLLCEAQRNCEGLYTESPPSQG